MEKHGYTITADGNWRPVTTAEYNRRAETREQVEYLRKIALTQTGSVRAETMKNIRRLIAEMGV